MSNIITTLAWPIIVSFIVCSNDRNVNSEAICFKTEVNAIDTFVYKYGDASKPPQFHRSYTIRVTSEQVYLSIDVYGKIISEDSSVLTTAAYNSFVGAVDSLHIKKKEEIKIKGCVGGTSAYLELYVGSSREVKGYIHNCGGQKDGDLEGNVALATNLFKALIPDLQQRIDLTKKGN